MTSFIGDFLKFDTGDSLDPTTDVFQGEKPNEDTCWGKTSLRLFILLYDDDVRLNRRNKRDGVKVV